MDRVVEQNWSVRAEAEILSAEEYVGQIEDRVMEAADEIGLGDRIVVGGGREGHLAVRVIVSAESTRVAVERGVAAFQELLTKSGVEVADMALEVAPMSSLDADLPSIDFSS